MGHDVGAEVANGEFGRSYQLQVLTIVTFCNSSLEWYYFHPDAQNSDCEIYWKIYQENSRPKLERAEAF